jgi:hypothetical protein
MPPFGLAGVKSPFGTCPMGTLNGPLAPMLHIWTFANPGGPFGDLPTAVEARLAQGISKGKPL